MYCSGNEAEKAMYAAVKMFREFTKAQKTQFLRMEFQRDSSKIRTTYESVQRLQENLQKTKEEVANLEQTEITLAKCSGAGSTPNDAKVLDAARAVIAKTLQRNKDHVVHLERFLTLELKNWDDLVEKRRSDENAFGKLFTDLYGKCKSHPNNMWFVWDSNIETEAVCAGCDLERPRLHWKKQADEMASEVTLPQVNIALPVLEKNE
jgi:hypothetical protein